jgi:hypothetical protein
MTSTAHNKLRNSAGATALWMLFEASDALGQGLPVETGSHWPTGLIWAGAVILGLVLAYGIMRNRSRTSSEKKLTEDVTANRYRSNTTTE